MKKLCISVLVCALAQPVTAQETQTIIFDDSEAIRFDANSCWFLSGSVREIMETPDDYRAIATDLRDAEQPIRRYVEDSLDRQQDAVGMAFRDFSAWYTHRVNEDNADALSQQQMAGVVGKGLDLALNYVFPGAGLLNRALRTAGSAAYGQLTSNAGGGNTNPQTYITQIGQELEDSEALRRTLADAMFNSRDNQALRNRVEAIKFEYVMERRLAVRLATQVMTEMTPDTCSGQMLSDMGLLRPSVANFNSIRRAVLTELVYEAFCISMRGNSVGNCETMPGRQRQIAEGIATRLIVVGRGNISSMWNLTNPAHLRLVCPDHYSFGAFSGPSPDCRRWATTQQNQ